MSAPSNHDRLAELIGTALSEMAGRVNPAKIGEIAELVMESMGGEARFFHSSEHIFHVSQGGDAIAVMAAVFHDLVYFQVDQGVALEIAQHIAPFVAEEEGRIVIRTNPDPRENPFGRLVLDLFGFRPGQVLTSSQGQNEFLSALTAASVLSDVTSLSHIAQIVVCIEATIPFRGNSASGLSALEELLIRFERVNVEMKLKFNRDDLRQAIVRAARLANQDVSNFADDNPNTFLEHTWDILPELNPFLREPSHFTVRRYRRALQSMEKFFTNLKPETVFQRFESEPVQAEYDRLLANAAQNIAIAQAYFRLRLVSLSILEALSIELGKSLSLSAWIGEIPTEAYAGLSLEKHLPSLQAVSSQTSGLEARVLILLRGGRSASLEHDFKYAPLTAYLVSKMGFHVLLQLWPLAQNFFEEQLPAEKVLAAVPAPILKMVTDAVAESLKERAQKIQGLVASLGKTKARG